MKNEKKVSARCYVCGLEVFVDQYGNGICNHCGWIQCRDVTDFPETVRYPNRVSYDKARQLYSEGKSLDPSFEDFVEMLDFYKEVEFVFQGKRYGVMWSDGAIDFYEFHVWEGFQTYQTTEEFKAKANIDGVLLKDLWDRVEEPAYMWH